MDITTSVNNEPDDGQQVLSPITVQLPHLEHQYLNVCLIAKTISSGTGLIAQNVVYSLCTIPAKNVLTTFKLFPASDAKLAELYITTYDLAVMDAVYTLSVYNCTTFTPSMIARVLSGNPTQDVTKNTIDTINQSLHKLRNIWISIDCTEEMRTRKIISRDENVVLQSPLLPLSNTTVTSGNHLKNQAGYHLTTDSALYVYAEESGQIARVPADIFRTTGMKSNKDIVIINRYLIRRIEAMKNTRNKIVSRQIIYEWYDHRTKSFKGMFSELGYNADQYKNWRDKKFKLHRIVKQCLEAFRQSGYISGFRETQNIADSRTSKIRGVEITYAAQKRRRSNR